MTAYTLSAAAIREICGLSDYGTRLLLDDPSLQPIKRYGPKGGAGQRFYKLCSILSVIRGQKFFTSEMEQALCVHDLQFRQQESYSYA